MQDSIIHTKHLFPILDEMLIDLLHSLTKEEWDKPTIAKQWSVKDIAAHLLDTNLRTLSFGRDGHQLIPDTSVETYPDLVSYLNQLNADWVKAAKRLSATVLIDLLKSSGREFCNFIQAADLHSEAVFSVAWAGEASSKNWFHIAREYTEKFIHQQQIRDAVNKPALITKELFHPFIDTFMRALPYIYRNTNAPEATAIAITVSSEAGGTWFIKRNNAAWVLVSEPEEKLSAHITMNPSTAWKLFSKGITPAEARADVIIDGNEELGAVALTMISVMA
ncbi:MAG: maleylpyruvate isomerase N-terminal domain-containing protein [Chitinophagaceae bacterium]